MTANSRYAVLVDEVELAAPGANTNIAEASLTVEAKRAYQVYRVTCCFAVSTVVKAIVTRPGGSALPNKFNNATAIEADAVGIFDIPVTGGDDFQLQIETDGAIRKLHIARVLFGGDI